MPDEQEQTIDIGAMSDKLAGDLFGDSGSDETTEEVVETAPASETTAAPAPEKPVETASPAPRAAPKTWPKEMHEHWGKSDPKLQDYLELREKQMLDGLASYKDDATFGKSLRDVMTPFKATIAAQGVDEPTAVRLLLNTHHRLSTGSPEERAAMFNQIAKSYGVDIGKLQATPQASPEIRALQDELSGIKSSLASREAATQAEARSRIAKEVEQFASDPAHPYFDDVADDIVAQLKAGADLQTAYDKAIWANPVTRAKETARLQTEAEAKAIEKAKQEAEAARKAASANVRSRDTKRAPTEPLGTMEDTMRKTLTEIRSRAH